jgi:hypothetical protein
LAFLVSNLVWKTYELLCDLQADSDIRVLRRFERHLSSGQIEFFTATSKQLFVRFLAFHLSENFILKIELSYAAKEKITKYYKLPNQLSEIIRILGIVIDFLVSSVSSNDLKIIDYATNLLKMEISQEADICKMVCPIWL